MADDEEDLSKAEPSRWHTGAGSHFPTYSAHKLRRLAASGLGELHAMERAVARMSRTTDERGAYDGAQRITPHVVTLQDVTRGLGLERADAQRIEAVVADTVPTFTQKTQTQRIFHARSALLSVLRDSMKHVDADTRGELSRRAVAYWQRHYQTDYGKEPTVRFGAGESRKSMSSSDEPIPVLTVSRLTQAPRPRYVIDLSKAARGGKYYRRVPTGNPKRPWRYYYTKEAYERAHGKDAHHHGPDVLRTRKKGKGRKVNPAQLDLFGGRPAEAPKADTPKPAPKPAPRPAPRRSPEQEERGASESGGDLSYYVGGLPYAAAIFKETVQILRSLSPWASPVSLPMSAAMERALQEGLVRGELRDGRVWNAIRTEAGMAWLKEQAHAKPRVAPRAPAANEPGTSPDLARIWQERTKREHDALMARRDAADARRKEAEARAAKERAPAPAAPEKSPLEALRERITALARYFGSEEAVLAQNPELARQLEEHERKERVGQEPAKQEDDAKAHERTKVTGKDLMEMARELNQSTVPKPPRAVSWATVHSDKVHEAWRKHLANGRTRPSDPAKTSEPGWDRFKDEETPSEKGDVPYASPLRPADMVWKWRSGGYHPWHISKNPDGTKNTTAGLTFKTKREALAQAESMTAVWHARHGHPLPSELEHKRKIYESFSGHFDELRGFRDKGRSEMAQWVETTKRDITELRASWEPQRVIERVESTIRLRGDALRTRTDPEEKRMLRELIGWLETQLSELRNGQRQHDRLAGNLASSSTRLRQVVANLRRQQQPEAHRDLTYLRETGSTDLPKVHVKVRADGEIERAGVIDGNHRLVVAAESKKPTVKVELVVETPHGESTEVVDLPTIGIVPRYVGAATPPGASGPAPTPAPAPTPSPKPSGPPAEPKPRPVPKESPRGRARQRTAEMVDSDYVNDRNSAIEQRGEDVVGSARHKAMEWKSLRDALEHVDAGRMFTRKFLDAQHPVDLISPMQRAQPGDQQFSLLFAHLVSQKFPAKPPRLTRGKSPEVGTWWLNQQLSRRATQIEYMQATERWKTMGQEERAKVEQDYERARRTGYYEAHETLRTITTALAERIMSGDLTFERAMRVYRDQLSEAMNNAHAERKLFAAECLRQVANKGWRGKGAATREIHGITKRIKAEGLGGAGAELSPEGWSRFREVAMQVMEGSTVAKAFGEAPKKRKSSRLDPASFYNTDVMERKGPASEFRSAKQGLDLLDGQAGGKFGMRSVQWGKSVTDGEREHHLKSCVDSFADLTDILGLPPQMASFNGRLAIAIGARGKGKALAHYEPELQVINLTRNSGAGSLAHEWGHFFDYVVREISEQTTGNRGRGRFRDNKRPAFERTRDPSYSQKTVPETPTEQAMKHLMDSPEYAAFSRRVRRVTRQRNLSQKTQEYWQSDTEQWARCFERYVQRKLETSGRENTYLVGVKDDADLWPTDEEVEGMTPYFDRIFEAFRNSGMLTKALAWLGFVREDYLPLVKGRPRFVIPRGR